MNIPKPLLWCGAGLFILAVGSLMLIQERKRHVSRTQTGTDKQPVTDLFADDLFRDAANWLSKRVAKSESEVEAELRKMVAAGNRPCAGFLDNLQRIDYELIKDDATTVRRTVAIAFQGTDGFAIGKITRKYSWEDLPREFRSEFIHNADRPQARNLFEKPH